RGLHVVDRALQHALEAQRGLGIAAIALVELGDGGEDGLLQVRAQAVEVGTAGLEHGFGGRVVDERKQQVLDRHVLVARLAGALVALADGVLEILAEHGALGLRKLATAAFDGGCNGGFPLPSPFTPFPWCTARGAGSSLSNHSPARPWTPPLRGC